MTKPSATAILELLRTRPEGVTALMALQEANCLRLAARIADLKAEGHCIETTLWTTRTGKRIAVYRLIEEPEQISLAL